MSYFKLFERPFNNILLSVMVLDLARSVWSVQSVLKLSLHNLTFSISEGAIMLTYLHRGAWIIDQDLTWHQCFTGSTCVKI